MKLEDIFITYTDKGELKEILDKLSLPSFGTKQESVARIMEKMSGKSPKSILALLDHPTLVEICRENKIEADGLFGLAFSSDDELVKKIIAKILDKDGVERKLEHKETTAAPSMIQGMKTLFGKVSDVAATMSAGSPSRPQEARKTMEAPPTASDPLTDLLRYCNKEDLQGAAEKLGLMVSGSKDEIIGRILNRTNRNPQDALSMLDNFSLQYIADRLNLPRRRGKDDQLDEILRRVFNVQMVRAPVPIVEEKIVTAAIRAPVQESYRPTAPAELPANTLFIKVVTEISEWTPDETYKSEEGYRTDLKSFLRARGFITRRETGDSRVDILVNDVIPIEIKKNPNKTEYTRAKGQMDNYCKEYGAGIVVICDAGNADLFEDFSRDVSRVCSGHPVRVIKKR